MAIFKKIKDVWNKVTKPKTEEPQALNTTATQSSFISSIWSNITGINAASPSTEGGLNSTVESVPVHTNPQIKEEASGQQQSQKQEQEGQVGANAQQADGSLTEKTGDSEEKESELDKALKEIKADILGRKKEKEKEAAAHKAGQPATTEVKEEEGEKKKELENNEQAEKTSTGQGSAGGTANSSSTTAAESQSEQVEAAPQQEEGSLLTVNEEALTEEEKEAQKAKAAAQQKGLELGRLKGRGSQGDGDEAQILKLEEERNSLDENARSGFNRGYNQGYQQGLAQKKIDIQKAREAELARMQGLPSYQEGQEAAILNASGEAEDKQKAKTLVDKQTQRRNKLSALKAEDEEKQDKQAIQSLEDEIKAYNMAYNKSFVEAQKAKVRAQREALLADPDYKAGLDLGNKIGEMATLKKAGFEAERNKALAQVKSKKGNFQKGYYHGYNTNYVNAKQKALEDADKELLKSPLFQEGEKAGKAAAELKVKDPKYVPNFASVKRRDAKYRQGFYHGYNRGYVKASQDAVDKAQGVRNPFLLKGLKIGNLIGNLSGQLGGLKAVEAKLKEMGASYKTVDELKLFLSRSLDIQKSETNDPEKAKDMLVKGKGSNSSEVKLFEKGYSIGYNQGYPKGQREAIYSRNGLNEKGEVDEKLAGDPINQGAEQGKKLGQELIALRMKARKEGRDIEAQVKPQIDAAFAAARAKGERYLMGFTRGYNAGLIGGVTRKGSNVEAIRVGVTEIKSAIAKVGVPVHRINSQVIEEYYPIFKKEGYEVWYKYYSEVKEGDREDPSAAFAKLRKDKMSDLIKAIGNITEKDERMTHHTKILREAFNKGKEGGMKNGLSYRAGYWLKYQQGTDTIEIYADINAQSEELAKQLHAGIEKILKPAGLSKPSTGFFHEGMDAATQASGLQKYQQSIGQYAEMNTAWMHGPQYEQGFLMSQKYWKAAYYQLNGTPLPEELESEFGEDVKDLELKEGQTFADYVKDQGQATVKKHFDKAQRNFTSILVQAYHEKNPPKEGEKLPEVQVKEGEDPELQKLIAQLQGDGDSLAELNAFKKNFQEGYALGIRSITGEVKDSDSDMERNMIQNNHGLLHERVDYQVAKSQSYLVHYLKTVWEKRMEKIDAAKPEELRKEQDWFLNFLNHFANDALDKDKLGDRISSEYSSGKEDRELLSNIQTSNKELINFAAELCSKTTIPEKPFEKYVNELKPLQEGSPKSKEGYAAGKSTGFATGLKTAMLSTGKFIFLGDEMSSAERQAKRMEMDEVLNLIRQYIDEQFGEDVTAEQRKNAPTNKEDAKAFGFFIKLEGKKNLANSNKPAERFAGLLARKLVFEAEKDHIKMNDAKFQEALALVQKKQSAGFQQGQTEAEDFIEEEYRRSIQSQGSQEEKGLELDANAQQALDDLLNNDNEVKSMITDIAQRFAAMEQDLQKRQKEITQELDQGFDALQIPNAMAHLPINSAYDFSTQLDTTTQQFWQAEEDKLNKTLDRVSSQLLETRKGEAYYRLDEMEWASLLQGTLKNPETANVEFPKKPEAELSIKGPTKLMKAKLEAKKKKEESIKELTEQMMALDAQRGAETDEQKRKAMEAHIKQLQATVKDLQSQVDEGSDAPAVQGLAAFLNNELSMDIIIRDQKSANYKGQEAIRLSASGYRIAGEGENLEFLGKTRIAVPVLEARLRRDKKIELKEELVFTSAKLSSEQLKTAGSLTSFLRSNLTGLQSVDSAGEED